MKLRERVLIELRFLTKDIGRMILDCIGQWYRAVTNPRSLLILFFVAATALAGVYLFYPEILQ